MGTASVLPPSWGEVVEQMRVGVGQHLASLKEPSEQGPSSELSSLARRMPAFDALEAALRRTEACAQDAENTIQSVADDLARWSSDCAQAARTLADRLERAVG
jgi:hypothetical protein